MTRRVRRILRKSMAPHWIWDVYLLKELFGIDEGCASVGDFLGESPAAAYSFRLEKTN